MMGPKPIQIIGAPILRSFPRPLKALTPTFEEASADLKLLLRGSWVVINGGISPLIWVITIATLLITPLITTHEPRSTLLPERHPGRSLNSYAYDSLGVFMIS